MSGFFGTRTAMQFFDGTLPRLVRELSRLNDNIEKKLEQDERHHRQIMGYNEPCDEPCHDPDLRGPHERGSDSHCKECKFSAV